MFAGSFTTRSGLPLRSLIDASSIKPFCVLTTRIRARLEARVYTDAIAGLPAAIAKRYDKTTALSLQKERDVMRLQKPHTLKTIADGATNERALERKQRVQPVTPSEGRQRTK